FLGLVLLRRGLVVLVRLVVVALPAARIEAALVGLGRGRGLRLGGRGADVHPRRRRVGAAVAPAAAAELAAVHLRRHVDALLGAGGVGLEVAGHALGRRVHLGKARDLLLELLVTALLGEAGRGGLVGLDPVREDVGQDLGDRRVL